MTVQAPVAPRPPAVPAVPDIHTDRDTLLEHFDTVRSTTTWLAEPLAVEDMVVQPMTDASPTKWHMAHTTWFFEAFVLRAALPAAEDFHPDFNYLFNSYYNGIGEQYPRPRRGLVTRPTVDEVLAYRAAVEERLRGLLHDADDQTFQQWAPVVELGLHHEQQHQELLLTDVKYLLGQNPLHPVYRVRDEDAPAEPTPHRWIRFEEGIHWIGQGPEGFSYDNERPRHRALVHGFELASRPVTCGEYMAFMEDGGYDLPEYWLSDGWATVRSEGWRAPLYWTRHDGAWWHFTLAGLRPVNPAAPVCHVSYYEADAFARWSGARLPTEFEWEVAAQGVPGDGNFVEGGRFHPGVAPDGDGLRQMMGDVWEWTGSAYLGYPGYRAPEGAIGEYNGKFMCNQLVLRGGSVATSRSHIRTTYRNFFYPHSRWQFTGLRLARDASA